MRGFPVDRYSDRDSALLFWAFGLLLGTGVTQNSRGDLVCPVTDMGVSFGYSGSASERNVRGYQSNADLNYHCDSADLVALLCVRKAKSGGRSTIVSTAAVYNRMVEEHPGHLAVLERGFPYDRKGEEGPGEPIISQAIPVFFHHADRVSSRYARSYIQGAAEKLGVPLTTAERDALACFDAICRSNDMALEMAFEPGDVQLLNNLTVIHGRTAYEDHADPARRRFLHRLWLDVGNRAPWNEENAVMRYAFGRFGNLGLSAAQWALRRSVGRAGEISHSKS